MSYSKTITFQFFVCGEGLETDGWWSDNNDVKFMEVRETRCNGTEDTHMLGFVVLKNDMWEWDTYEIGRELFDEYASEAFSDELLKYINENPPPKAE